MQLNIHSLVLSLSIVAVTSTSVIAQRQYEIVDDTIRWSRCTLYEQSTLFASLIVFTQNCTADKSDTLIASWEASITGDEEMLLIQSNDSAAHKIRSFLHKRLALYDDEDKDQLSPNTFLDKSTHTVGTIILNHNCSTNATDTLIVIAKVVKDSIDKMSIALLPNDPAAKKIRTFLYRSIFHQKPIPFGLPIFPEKITLYDVAFEEWDLWADEADLLTLESILSLVISSSKKELSSPDFEENLQDWFERSIAEMYHRVYGSTQDVIINTPDWFVVLTNQAGEGTVPASVLYDCYYDHFLRKTGERITLRDIIAPDKWDSFVDTVKYYLAYKAEIFRSELDYFGPVNSSDYHVIVDSIFKNHDEFFIPENTFLLTYDHLHIYYTVLACTSMADWTRELLIKIPLSSIIPLSRMPSQLQKLQNTPEKYRVHTKIIDCWNYR